MSLLEDWRNKAYAGEDVRASEKLWKDYFEVETGIYRQMLQDPSVVVEGTVAELAERYGTDLMTMTGFLDGINESIKEPNPIETMEADTPVRIEIVPEALYKNMVAAKADWLYGLEEWEHILPADQRKTLMKEQRLSGTVVKGKKIGRNDPCPCGSGKKYKYCCGRTA